MNKIQGNRAYIEHDNNLGFDGFNPTGFSNDHAITRSVRIEVYKGAKYQGKKIFSQDRIIIGKSLEADLVLADDEIADKHACITYIDEQLVILDQTQKTGLLIRGGLYGISIISSSEQVGIGPYILSISHNQTTNDQKCSRPVEYGNSSNKEIEEFYSKNSIDNTGSRQVGALEQDSKVVEPHIKKEKSEVDLSAMFEGSPVEDPVLYDLIFEGNIKAGSDIDKVKRNLVKILKSDESRIEHFLSRKRVVLKSGLEIDIAKKYKKLFDKTGAVCRLTVHSSTESHSNHDQEEGPEKVTAATPEQNISVDANEVYEEKPDDDYETQIGSGYISSDDDYVISQDDHSDTEESTGIQLQSDEPALKEEKEEAANSIEGSQTNYEDLIKTNHYPETEVYSEVQTQTSEQNVVEDEEEIVSYIEETKITDKAEQIDSLPQEEKAVWKFYRVGVDDEDEEDEEDLPADFLLKDKIAVFNTSDSRQKLTKDKYLEVIKLRGDNIIDIKHLEEKEKFYISNDKGKRFCLAEVKGLNEALFSFNKKLQGYLEIEGKAPVETLRLMTDENCISKRKGTYQTRVPNKGKVLVSDGYFDYQMQIVNGSLVPKAPEIVAQKKSYRHYGVSFAFHIVFLLFLGLFPSFDNGKNMEDETRFVQLDSTQLAELEKVMNPQPKPPPPKPPAVMPEQQIEPTVLKKKPEKVASNKKPSNANSKKASRPSRHPDAGGGFGEGNVATRNINEAGILGMLSDTVGIQPRNALAAVTNLDAVSSPNVRASNLTVGGVVGKLGTGEIAVPKGTIVATKGSSQVLRSYGRKGEGTVAALEKGKIGEQEVMGMVTATLDKSARIRGGLSMEAVKRVIDEHLDDITYCYETELIANPSIVGKVMFEWKILMSGEVGEVRIKSSSINSHEIHTCIKDAIRTWRFPKPRGSEVMVSYPFVFDIVGF